MGLQEEAGCTVLLLDLPRTLPRMRVKGRAEPGAAAPGAQGGWGSQGGGGGGGGASRSCFVCGGEGHWARDCPDKGGAKPGGGAGQQGYGGGGFGGVGGAPYGTAGGGGGAGMVLVLEEEEEEEGPKARALCAAKKATGRPNAPRRGPPGQPAAGSRAATVPKAGMVLPPMAVAVQRLALLLAVERAAALRAGATTGHGTVP